MNDSIPQKQCPQCKQFYPLTKDYFRVCKREKNGLTHACRECLKKRDAIYLDNNRDKNKERGKKRYHEKVDEYKAYKKKNAEKIAQQKRDWRKNNPDKVKKHKHDSNKRHPESRQRRLNKYIIRHPETSRLRGRVAAMKRRVKTDMTKRSDLLQMYEDQNGRCAYCGISIYWSIKGDIHVDHIKPVVKGGSNNLENLCLTCADCNYSKSDNDLEEWLQKFI